MGVGNRIASDCVVLSGWLDLQHRTGFLNRVRCVAAFVASFFPKASVDFSADAPAH